MSQWPLQPLHELLIRLENGSRPQGGVSTITEGVPSLGGEHLNKEGGFDFEDIKFVSEEFFQKMRRGVIQREDILVVKDGATTGKIAFVGADFPYPRAAINEHVFLLRVNQKLVLPRFIFFFLFSSWGQTQILACFRGAAIGGITQDFARIVEVPLPPLAEQDRIVRILDEAEALRHLRAQAYRRTEAVVPALFDELFGDPISNPKQWPVVKVSRFVRRFQAGNSVAPAGEERAASKYRILRVSAVTWGRFAPEESKPVPDSYVPTPHQLVRLGDMLLSRANTTELVGAVVLVETNPDNLLLSDKLWRFVWDESQGIEPRFVLSLFQHPSIRRELGNRATGTGGSMKNISMEKVMAMEVPLPPIDIQLRFATHVVEIRALDSAQATSKLRLDELFRSLLHRAFQGEL